MVNLSEHAGRSIPPSPSHGSLSLYGGGGGGYSPIRSYNTGSARSEVASPGYRGDMSIDRRNRNHLAKYSYPADRRSMPAGLPVQTLTAQTLQSKTMAPEDYRDLAYMARPEEVDIDAKLSRLCEQDKVVRTQEDKLQQLHREKHTLETALLSASQEIELGGGGQEGALQSVVQQRDLLQSGLLSTCRELARVSAERERGWRDYERLEADVGLAKNSLLERLEALGSPQTEPPSQQHVHIQKELWRIQDVMEALGKNRAQRKASGLGPRSDDLGLSSKPISSTSKTEGAVDYRLYRSEPELTTVTEVDENGDERSEHAADRDAAIPRGQSYPVGIVPPRTKSPMPDPAAIPSYVTLRKGRKSHPPTDRPRSAVEQLCAAESGGRARPNAVEQQESGGRARMSVEEQLERIRRHQQGALREKKRGLNVPGAGPNVLGAGPTQDGHAPSPSRSASFNKENPFRSTQSHSRRREEVMCSDIEALEASLREQDVVRETETPAAEIARLKEALVRTEHFNMERELCVPDKVLIPERHQEAEPELLSPEEEAARRRKVDRIRALIAKTSMPSVASGVAQSAEEEAHEEATAYQEQEKIINISYELAAEASKRSKLVAAQALASVKTFT